MGIFSKFEGKMEDTFEGAAGKMSNAPISPVQIAKKAEKQMRRGTMVGAGKQYAPTLYTVLVNPDDDARLFGYYPTLAGETETYLSGKASQEGLVMDGRPLVRFIVDDSLKHGKFEVIAEMVAAPIIAQLREEEMERYGINPRQQRPQAAPQQDFAFDQPSYEQPAYDQPAYEQPQPAPQQDYQTDFQQRGYQPDVAPAQAGYANDAWNNGYNNVYDYAYEPPEQRKPPLPYVPENEIDRSIDYGEYTFNSEDFEDYRGKADAENVPHAYNDAPYVAGPAPEPQPQQPQQPQPQPQPQAQAANTVAFAGGTGAAPDRNAVRARLVDLTYQRPYDLAGTLMRMGRESSNDIVVQDINASRRHAELRLNTQGIWVITDLSSMNGTLVNGVSVASHPLYPGDIVTIGKTDFEFTLV